MKIGLFSLLAFVAVALFQIASAGWWPRPISQWSREELCQKVASIEQERQRLIDLDKEYDEACRSNSPPRGCTVPSGMGDAYHHKRTLQFRGFEQDLKLYNGELSRRGLSCEN